MRKIIGLLVLVGAVYVGYNYFFGNDAKKEQATTVVDGTKKAVGGLVNMFKKDKENLDADGMNDALKKVNDIIEDLRGSNIDLAKYGEDLKDLTGKKDQLEEMVKVFKDNGQPKEEGKNITEGLGNVLNDLKDLSEKLN